MSIKATSLDDADSVGRKPTTIDNLGSEAYSKLSDGRLSKADADFMRSDQEVARQTALDISKAILHSNLDEFLQASPPNPWSTLEPPPHFFEQTKRLFTHQVAPNFGSSEKLENQLDRIDAKAKQSDPAYGSKLSERDHKQVKKEAATLRGALETIDTLNRMLKNIMAERNGFGKA